MFSDLRLSDRNLILTGYTGPNQPRIGQSVADKLNMPFVDFGLRVADRTGYLPDEIRNVFGEQRLKTVINESMDEIVLHRHYVIRLDGSTLMYGDHFQELQRTGPVICLVARLDAILQRLHLSLGARYHDPAQRAMALGELKRQWAVRALDGIYELDVTTKNEAETIDAVVELWQQVAVERA